MSGPPETDIEKAIGETWSEILGRTVDDTTVSWTSLGGDSVGAVRVASRIRARLGVQLNLATVLRCRTVGALAAAVEAARPVTVTAEEGPALVPRTGGAAPPMSFFQDWRFRADQGVTAPLYNLTLGFALDGALDTAALGTALTEMARRHEPLRTNYAIVEDRPIQRIHSPSTVELPVFDLRKLPEDEQRPEAVRQFGLASAHPLDREREPLFQPFLARMSGDRHLLMLLTDRMAIDGTSLRLIVEELSMLYTCARTGGTPAPAPAVQQADWAIWQRGRLRGERLDRLTGYWRRKLDADRPLIEQPMPPGLSTPARGPDGRFAQLPLGAGLSGEIGRRLADLDVTLYMYALAALQLLTSRLSGRDEATVLTPFANRTRQAVERTIGCFSHGVIYRTDLSGDPSFAELVGRVRDVCLDAWEHQELPISEVARHVRPQSALKLFDEFHVFFDVTHDQPGLTLDGVRVSPTPVGPSSAHPSLAVFLHDGGDGLTLTLRGEADRFPADALDWLAAELVAVLRDGTATPATRVSRLGPSRDALDRRFGS
jgi:acyl carrier protein